MWIFILSFAAGLAGTWMCRQIACRFQIIDKPDNTVKTHSRPVAYLGGMGILAGFAAGMVWVFFKGGRPAGGGWLLAASVVICLVGLVDDIRPLLPRQKIAGQVAAAAAAVFFLRPYLSGAFPSLPSWGAAAVSFGLLVFFVLGACNSVNLLDGLDGLCGGVTFFMCAGFFVLACLSGSAYSSFQAAMAVCLAGGTAGFLVFNYPPAVIFMGDAGSLLIGLILTCEMILFLLEGPAAFLASLFIFGLPILDTSVAILRRALNRRPLFAADRGHIYDQFVDRGLSKTQSIWACYGLSVLFSAIGLFGYKIGLKWAVPLYLLTALVSFLLLWRQGFLKKV
ncbi:MAG: undecaprenyl/decaprenyl-phosphate alpha-N-acetylglucosaminyl 1-phosphate transferase [Phycisphaerae bacterium]|nr:undecaprenyl/decaprenyl-phosphate alpha-N-acetylglucosaminyl 1-phosphate transferase [Phycisphaerae bacterium]